MIKAVVFDLDGTITRPFLNFSKIRLEIGVETGRQSLLDQIESMPEPEKSRANKILESHEEKAAANAEMNQGVAELLSYIRERGLKTGLVTRNSGKSTDFVLAKLGVSFDMIITRDSDFPVKPDPAPLVAMAEEWDIAPANILMIGDFLYDVIFGKAAGARTCLVTNNNAIENTGDPDWTVTTPGEVIEVLKEIGHD